MKPKSIITEFTILIVIYIATWLLVSLPTASLAGNASIDINLPDTYFVIGRTAVVIPVFLILVTLIYLIRAIFYRYKGKLQNLILVVANFLSLIVLYPISVLIGMISESGGTLYPPLSALPKTIPPARHQDINAFFFIKQITPCLIIIFMLILVISAILTGKNWNTDKHEQQAA